MKKSFIICTSLLLLICMLVFYVCTSPFMNAMIHEPHSQKFRAVDKKIEIQHDGVWEDFKIKGVNLGSSYPGFYPNEYGIGYDEYYRWFEMMAKMNANTLRVYHLESPVFYHAFSDYNKEHEDKLYLIQNISVKEKIMYSESIDEFEMAYDELIEETRDIIKAIHGDYITIDNNRMLYYSNDVSDYILGYVLGIEWDRVFVEYINRIHNLKGSFKGNYIYCSNDSTTFDNFLGKWADDLLTYEQDTYHERKLISLANWAETDPFINDMRLDDFAKPRKFQGLEVKCNFDHIKAINEQTDGIFISYNIYPYYPLFLQYGEYTNYVDEKGNHNAYQKYLIELQKFHQHPIVISEYGVPTSRSKIYHERLRNFTYGGLNETQQANAVKELYHDINKANCAGSLVFSWHDEWYKNSWNDKLLSNRYTSARWNDMQSAEQNFGILSFESLKNDNIFYPDGNFDEWENIPVIQSNKNFEMKMSSDAKYVHFYLKGMDRSHLNSVINIALDTTPKSGKNNLDSKQFNQPVDFIIQIKPKGESALYVDRYYDIMPYSILGISEVSNVGKILYFQELFKNQSITLDSKKQFSVVTRADEKSYRVLSKKKYDKQFKLNQVGFLKAGDANPTHRNYDSNTDYCIKGNEIEIRIPWQLLNFYDPSSCEVVHDFNKHNYKIDGLKIDKIYASAFYDDAKVIDDFGSYKLKAWKQPVVKERLRKVYYTLQDEFKGD